MLTFFLCVCVFFTNTSKPRVAAAFGCVCYKVERHRRLFCCCLKNEFEERMAAAGKSKNHPAHVWRRRRLLGLMTAERCQPANLDGVT